MTMKMRIENIRKEGLEALTKKLGPDGMIRFMQQFDSGSGYYTKDRHRLLDNYSIDDIVQEIKNKY